MRILIIAGEESGEIYGARLMRELKAVIPQAEFHGVGGDRMVAEGLHLIQHARDMASIGLVQMLEKIGFFMVVLKDMRARVKRREYDAIILIDYPDFNLRIARAGHEAGVPVFYYVCPQFWAWRKYRINAVKRWVKTMLVVLPFEEALYRERGIDARFIGHPMMDEIDLSPDRRSLRRELMPSGADRLIGILPGSRTSEVKGMLEPLLETADIIHRQNPGAGFVLPVAGHIPLEEIKTAVGARAHIHVIKGRSHDVMAASDLLITKSGTSTLEAALYGTPMIIVYRLAAASYWFAKMLSNVKFAGLPNIIADREVAAEFIQDRFKPAAVAAHALALLSDESRMQEARSNMNEVKNRLGVSGAAKRAAAIIAAGLGSNT